MTFEEFFDIEPTFEEVVKKYGNEEIYKGTNVDEATQQILEDYFFDYEIGADEKTFLRYYKRRLNEFYNQYMAENRTLAIINNMDPYVQSYLEEKTTSGRTYDRTRSTKQSTTGTGNTTGTTTPNLTTTTTKTGTDTTAGTNGNTETRDLTSTTESKDTTDATANGKNRNFSIAYPEANMGEIPASIDDTPSIAYASGENYGLSKQTTNSTTAGKSTTTDTGTLKNEGSNNTTLTHNTTDETKNTGTNETSTESNTATTAEGADKEGGTDNTDFERIQKGRVESVADIIPRVISAIEMTDPTKYFIEKIKICFNTVEI